MHEMSAVKTDEQTWFDLLHEAYETMEQSHAPVYVTLTTALKGDVHPLGLLSATDAADSFYWVTPDRRTFMSATGTVASLHATGPGRFHELHQDLKQARFISNAASLPAPYGQGPLLFGGFAFAPASSNPFGPWADFPDGLLHVPAFSVIRHDGTSWLGQTILLDSQRAPLRDALPSFAARLESKRARVYQQLRGYRAAPDATGPNQPNSNAHLPSIAFDESEVRHWTHAVNELTTQARQGRVVKTVLSRHVDIPLAKPIVLERLLTRLEKEHPRSFIFALIYRGRTFVGATPERLLQIDGQNLRTEALAGSTPRGETESEDVRLAHRLLHSDKERHEQKIVLEWLMDRLQKWCVSLETPGKPAVVRFPTVQHLHTPITGVLRAPTHILEIIEAIHPTPAVGGYPLDTALSLIATYEQESRGWYAGPIGWVNPAGSGEFAVGIRSALISQDRARLFAGCGIVDGSDPQQELAEARLKLGVIFDSLVRALS